MKAERCDNQWAQREDYQEDQCHAHLANNNSRLSSGVYGVPSRGFHYCRVLPPIESLKFNQNAFTYHFYKYLSAFY